MEELVAVIKGNIGDFQAKMNQVSSKLDNVSKKFKKVGETASKFVTLPVLAAGAASFKMASDYQESLNKVDVAFKDSAEEVKKWSETTLKAYGIASGTALDMAALYGDMATSMGFNAKQAAKMSMELVGLAGDMASFKNISIDVANTALKSIFTGETESLKTLGIVMTEANIKAWMLSEGIKGNYEKMDQAQKVAIRYNYVLAQTANSQGDFARTGGGAANQMRIMMESLKELGVTFGQVLLPAVTEIIKKINKWLESLRNLSPETKKLIVVIAALAAALGPVSLALSGILKIIPLIAAGGRLVMSGWFPVIAVITAVAGAFFLVKKWQDEAARTADEISDIYAGRSLKNLKETLAYRKKDLEILEEEQNILEKTKGTVSGWFGGRDQVKETKNQIRYLEMAIEKKEQAIQKEKEFKEDLAKTNAEFGKMPKLDWNMPGMDFNGVQLPTEEPPIFLSPQMIKGIDVIKKDFLGRKQDFLDIQKVMATPLPERVISDLEQYSNGVYLLTNRIRDGFSNAINTTRQVVLDMNALMEDLIENSITAFASEIGNVLGGGDFGLDRILTMFADWAIKLGSILIAAGISIESFKTQILANPLGVVALGAALVAAGAAVKSAVQTNPTSSSGAGSSSGGGRDNWDAFGERNLRGKIEVQVNGVLKGSGRDLYGVITKENTRKSL